MIYQPFPPWGSFTDLFAVVAERFRSAAPPPESEDDLRTCGFCGQPYVGPLECSAEGARFRILLRCGNCDSRRRVLVSTLQATRFECDVAHDMIKIAREAERLDGERFAAQTTAFAAALARDLIDASDFG
jgi:hypothetical protein